MTSPDFSIIKFVKNKNEDLVTLLSFFEAVSKREALNIAHTELLQILGGDLNINLSNIEHHLKLVLTESLMYYMKVWPGWQRFADYQSGRLSFKDWFERFRQYLILKTRFVIKSASDFQQNDTSGSTDAFTQTDVNYADRHRKPYAPFTLCISGPPPILNNVVFVQTEGNILIKQYPLKDWQNLTVHELFNWPFFCVELKLPDLSLSRTIAQQTHRYMSLAGDAVVAPEVNRVINAKKLLGDGVQQSFSYDFMKCYFQQLLQIFNSCKGISSERVEELQTVLIEFLEDISEVNLFGKTVCTNISVSYIMGGSKYVRSRKMVKSNERDSLQNIINYYELVIPQVDFILHSLSVDQDETDKTNITFKNLNLLEESLKSKQQMEATRILLNQCLIYKCTICKESFTGHYAKGLLIEHFSIVHKGEQSVRCYKCHNEFTIQQLAGNRWKHNCKMT